MRTFYFGILWLVLLILSGCSSNKIAPFEQLRWQDKEWQVQISDDWYRLIAIEGQPLDSITEQLRQQNYQWRREFIINFKASLGAIGLDLDNSIAVTLLDRTGRVVKMQLDLSKDKFRKNLLSADTYSIANTLVNSSICASYQLGQSLDLQPYPKVDLAKATAFINKIEGLIDNTYAYRDRTSFDYKVAFSCLRHSVNSGLTKSAFNLGIKKLLSNFGDGHLRLLGAKKETQYLPFLVFNTELGYLALHQDRERTLDKKHPYIVSIDGKSIEFWLDIAARFAAKGSKSLSSLATVKNLRYLPMLRREAGVRPQDTVVVGLSDAHGKSIVYQELSLTDESIKYGGWPHTETRLLDDNTGYLRIAKMSKNSDFIDQAMQQFSQTKGLIIDVRGNGGGRRTILKALMPYFLDEKELYVSNLAKYRIMLLDDQPTAEGYLVDRYLYPSSSSQFSHQERQLLNKFTAAFKPNWQGDHKIFSNWHVMVHRTKDNPKRYRYDKPVIILMDQMNFSATDIFLNAMKNRDNITLIGQASGGGSGRSQYYFLPAVDGERFGGIITIPTMISYKTNGDLVEGVGIQPDIMMDYSRSDLTGKTDSMLNKAKAMLSDYRS